MTPVQQSLLNYALAAAAGGLVGRSLARKHPWQSAILGATAVMALYGVSQERVLTPAA